MSAPSSNQDWKDLCTLEFPISPMGTPRGRATGKIVRGKNGKPAVLAWVYNPAAYKKYVNQLKAVMKKGYSGSPSVLPIRLTLHVHFCTQGRKMEADLDNYTKAVKDAGNKILWRDDVQVTHYGDGFCKKKVETQDQAGIWMRAEQMGSVPYRKSWSKPASPKKLSKKPSKATRRNRPAVSSA